MKVLDLQCRQGHAFEGWFASQEDYASQRERGLLTCPVCNDAEVSKKLSAPRLNLGRSAEPAAPAPDAPQFPATAPAAQAMPALPQALQAAMLKMVRHVMANTEDVGTRFAEEARKIHYGETESRNIRGQASREETEALQEEGIAVMPLPMPAALKGPVQ